MREMCAHHIYSNKNSVLFEAIPLIFEMIFGLLKEGDTDCISEAVSILEDFNISMDAFKEHIIGLQLDQKNIDNYNNLPAPVKGNFTKIYNSVFKSSIKSAKKKVVGSTTSGGCDGFTLQKNVNAVEEPTYESWSEEEEPDDGVVVEQIKGKKPAGPARGGGAGTRGGRGGAAAPNAYQRGGARGSSFARGRGAPRGH